MDCPKMVQAYKNALAKNDFRLAKTLSDRAEQCYKKGGRKSKRSRRRSSRKRSTRRKSRKRSYRRKSRKRSSKRKSRKRSTRRKYRKRSSRH